MRENTNVFSGRMNKVVGNSLKNEQLGNSWACLCAGGEIGATPQTASKSQKGFIYFNK